MTEVQANNAPEKASEEDTKMLGAHVPEDLYWKFKHAAATRKEQLKDAVAHAAMMYIDAHKDKE